MNRTIARTLLICTATLLLSVGRAEAQTVTSTITKDTTLYFHSWAPLLDHNFGGYVKGGYQVVGFDDRGGASSLDKQRPLLQSDTILTDLATGGVSSASHILSAELHLFQVFPHIAPDRTGAVHRMLTGWVEGSAQDDYENGASTWNNVMHGGNTTPSVGGTTWGTPGGDFDPVPLSSFGMLEANDDPIERTFDITNAVKHWWNNPTENFGITMIQDPLGDTPAYFAASEDTTDGGALVPFITTYIVPEPGSMVLIVTGMAWLALCVGRRHAHRSSD